MKRASRPARGLPWLAPLMILVLGCATLRLPDLSVANVSRERQRRRQEAVRQFDESRALAEFQSAEASWDGGDGKACEQSLRLLLERDPAHRDARLLLTEVYLTAHRTAEACAEVQQALEAHPDDPQVQYAMGLALEMSGRGGEALAYYERAAKWEPDNELYAVGYHTALKAASPPVASAAGSDEPRPVVPQKDNVARPRDGRPDEQERSSPRAGVSLPSADKTPEAAPPGAVSSADPATPGPVLSLTSPPSKSEAAATSGGVAGAEAVHPAGRAGSAGNAAAEPIEALLQQADAALCEGSPEQALACFREAASLRPNNPQILISAATIALRHNQPDLAIELLQPAAKHFAGSAPLQRILGAAYYRLGDYQSSQVALQQALSLDKSSALSYFLMGCTLHRLGQRESAEAHFRQAQALDRRYAVWR